jgi:putative ABC transport system permease protein
MDILPILTALKRQKTAAALIAIEIALCCAIVCNALFLIAQRVERAGMTSGAAETELVRLRAAGLGVEPDAIGRARADVAALAALPGVKAATMINQVPYGDSSWNSSVRLSADDTTSAASVGVYYGEQLIDVLGLRLVAGRDFEPEEYADFEDIVAGSSLEPAAVIVTRTLARVLFGDDNPLGQELYVGRQASRVIGVVDRLQRVGRSDDAVYAESSMILPVRMSPPWGQFLLRTEPAMRESILAAARQTLSELSPNRIVLDANTVEQMRSDYLRRDRVMAGILIAVVASLLIVTALGIVGLASFWVQRRRRQIGIRRALGATRRQILRYFQTENFLIVSAGIVLGMLAAYAISGWLMQQYEMPRLPWLYLPAGAVTLWLLGQIAVLAPALRAAAVPPATATRTV